MIFTIKLLFQCKRFCERIEHETHHITFNEALTVVVESLHVGPQPRCLKRKHPCLYYLYFAHFTLHNENCSHGKFRLFPLTPIPNSCNWVALPSLISNLAFLCVGCKIICGAPTTLAVKGLMMMMIIMMMMTMKIWTLPMGSASNKLCPAFTHVVHSRES